MPKTPIDSKWFVENAEFITSVDGVLSWMLSRTGSLGPETYANCRASPNDR
jgi:hypothetical protein